MFTLKLYNTCRKTLDIAICYHEKIAMNKEMAVLCTVIDKAAVAFKTVKKFHQAMMGYMLQMLHFHFYGRLS